MMKIIPLITLILFSLASYSYAETQPVKTNQYQNVDKAGQDDDAETDQRYRDYYAGIAPQKTIDANGNFVESRGTIPQAVQAGVAFRSAIEANTATADAIAQARANYMRAAAPELDQDGNPIRCYKYSQDGGKLDVVPCNADPVQQAGSQYVGATYSTATKSLESTTPSTNVGLTRQNRPYTPPVNGK